MARSAKEISKRRAAARRKQKRQDRIAILILIGIVLVIAIIVGSFLGGREKKNLKNQETGKTTAYTLSPDMTKPTDANETKKTLYLHSGISSSEIVRSISSNFSTSSFGKRSFILPMTTSS